MVGEAGGRVTDFSGGGNFVYGREIVAANAHVHREMLDTLAEGLN